MARRDRFFAGGVLNPRLPRPRCRSVLLLFAALVAGLAGLGGCAGEQAAEGESPVRTTPASSAVAAVEGDAVDSTPVAPGPDRVAPSGPAGTAQTTDTSRAADSTAVDEPPDPPPPVELPSPEDRPRFERPEHVRGIYLNAWNAGSARRVAELLELARRTEINSFVIDLKDATGYVSHSTAVEEARTVGAVGEIRIRDLPGLLRRLEEEGIYPIARIVIVKDPLLAEARPELAVQDTAGGIWIDSKEIRWLNLFDERVADYHIALAREAVALGFPEIQWDYVRFADAPREDIERTVYPGRDGRPQSEAVRAFLERSREELGEMGAAVTADVFGVTTSAHDVGIGQIWEEFIDVVDVALPMVYPSHYWRGSFGLEHPNGRPYEVVKRALDRAVERSAAVEGAGSVRPWLQDFTLGPPPYGAAEVRAQIQAVYDAGLDEWLLWNPSSRYTVDALEPAEGWTEEPLILVGGSVVPVSEREEALAWAEALGLDTVPPVPARVVAPDTTKGGGE